MNFLRTSLLVAADPSLEERVRQIMTSESSYQELESIVREVATTAGQSITYGKVSAGLSRFAGESDPDIFARFIRRRWEETEMVGSFSKMHSDIFTELDLVSKPDEVEKVFLRGLISPSGSKSFDIKLKGIPAVWFKDGVSSAKANFTFAETISNFFQNYVTAWNAAPFGTYYFNTVFVAIVTTFAEIIFAAMAAFAFAKMEFFGKNLIFTLFLATMMVPGEVLLVPNYITLTALGWIDSYYALIVPWVVSVFAIFLLRQHFMTIPNELYDAAMIDGLTKWRFLWTVMVPLSKPAVITGALLKFVGSWNSFLWVLIVTKSPEIRTLPVGLQNFSSATGSDYHLLMAAATFSVIPVVILFLLTQKYFIAGIARSGLK
jgi:multiple sugar transport system permease protein